MSFWKTCAEAAMPKRADLRSVLLIGSGPITIGQACEFDYSGVQALRALKEEGIKVVLVNSNPATIMTDPDQAHRTYIEPLSASFLERVIERERPDALLPTMGGQTALNLSLELHERGVLDRYGVQLIGASVEAIRLGEDRLRFRELMSSAGFDTCRGHFAHDMEEARKALTELGLPLVIRPSFTLGGTGGGIAEDIAAFEKLALAGLQASPTSQILIEESLVGWKEYEFEVIRDQDDNAVVICSIENIDAMGVHTGDSITVAPAQTLSDGQYQRMRSAALRILRLVGVDSGGSNVQFALDPQSDRMVVVEMNPRVSRSSALASKATGYPIAAVATRLALGYFLHELPNPITGTTPASFEPALDYVVVKIPRWAFEKFPSADQTLTTQMKSVGEVMAIARTFKEAMQKAIQSLEIGVQGFGSLEGETTRDLLRGLRIPNWQRLRFISKAFNTGMSVAELAGHTGIDPWFLAHWQQQAGLGLLLREIEPSRRMDLIAQAKCWGFSDLQLARLWQLEEEQVRMMRSQVPYGFKAVDSCAGEFPALTPYLYGCYGEVGEIEALPGRKVVLLGSGPNRIGQGIEFDYSCVQAIEGFRRAGLKVILINNNPETVSTDFNVADRLYFEPLSLERVLHVLELERPDGVVVAFGGQTALNLAGPLHRLGFAILGTQPAAIDLAEDRQQFAKLCKDLCILQAEHRMAFTEGEAREMARCIGYPVMVRPSFVLGGRAMAIAFDENQLQRSLAEAFQAMPDQPILLDSFLDDAIEVDVDALSDGEQVLICGVMQHIEAAGIHSGDSSCVLPSPLLTRRQDADLRAITRQLALTLGVRGPLNVQFALFEDRIYVLEANPRCARTVPFAAKACGIPFAALAAELMAGRKLAELWICLDPQPRMWHVKTPVFPFPKMPGEDPITGPEMKSTGEVMGSAMSFGSAFAKAYRAAGAKLPRQGRAFLSVNDRDKGKIAEIGRGLYQLGFDLCATQGTAEVLRAAGLPVELVAKVHQGEPHIAQAIAEGSVALVVNTPIGKHGHVDDRYIRLEAQRCGVPCLTTLSASRAAIEAIRAIKSERLEVFAIQDWQK
jgi:carbamoyl-phosphate synthase large subunit